MNYNLVKIKTLCDHVNFSGNKSDEYLFSINCVDYFYFSKNIGQIDIMDGFVDGAGDGGIDFILSRDSNKLLLIQGKSSNSLSYNDIRDVYNKMLETVRNFKSKNYSQYSDKLYRTFIDVTENMDEPDINFVLFTNTVVTSELMDKIQKNIISAPEFQSYTIEIYGKNEIDDQVLSIDTGNMEVPEDSLLLDSTNNYLTYQNEKGAIFSIKASSLKKLYNKYSKSGLFGYNLREQISQKSVDSAIDKTIKHDKDNFWFFNNGITIGCSDYRISGNKLVLYDFSIINGAQTTSKIGLSKNINDDYDFSLVCKVIKSENSLSDDFIRKISEASNSQKPIKFRDLKSNSKEQQILQNNSINASHQLAIEIKRGVRPVNYKIVDSWKRVTNEYIGQLLLACQYQKPGTARSKTADIFAKDETYNLLFARDKVINYDYDTIFEFVRIAHYYDDFKIQYVQDNYKKLTISTSESEKISLADNTSICNNGKFVILSIIFYCYKRTYMGLTGYNDKKIDSMLITGDLSLDYDDSDYFDKLEYLFKFIIQKLSYIYKENQAQLKLTSHSNFFKSDKNYLEVILPEFDKILLDKYDSIKILDNIKIFKD